MMSLVLLINDHLCLSNTLTFSHFHIFLTILIDKLQHIYFTFIITNSELDQVGTHRPNNSRLLYTLFFGNFGYVLLFCSKCNNYFFIQKYPFKSTGLVLLSVQNYLFVLILFVMQYLLLYFFIFLYSLPCYTRFGVKYSFKARFNNVQQRSLIKYYFFWKSVIFSMFWYFVNFINFNWASTILLFSFIFYTCLMKQCQYFFYSIWSIINNYG